MRLIYHVASIIMDSAAGQALSPTGIDSNYIVQKASHSAFGKPLVTNILRAMLVEAIVDCALSPSWKWCSADYAGWDFEGHDGIRLEVKQSAARQSWTVFNGKPSKSSFDIAPRTGHWVGADWFPGAGRNAQIYIFAHHPVEDASADHRDPNQWVFYVVPTEGLPAQKTISLLAVQRLVQGTRLSGLKSAVNECRSRLSA
jgi:hypothetical protein